MSVKSWAQMSASQKAVEVWKTCVFLCVIGVVGIFVWGMIFGKSESPEKQDEVLAVAREKFRPSPDLLSLRPSGGSWLYSGLCSTDIHNRAKHGVTFNVSVVDSSLSTTRKHFDYCVDMAHRELIPEDGASDAAMEK